MEKSWDLQLSNGIRVRELGKESSLFNIHPQAALHIAIQ
jgi:hypothetical protein